MNLEIHLDNPYFPWTKTEGNNLKCWQKGDMFFNDTILEGPGIISLFSSLPSSSGKFHDALKDLLLSINGSFALVIETRDSLLCIVDRTRSIPLFYAKTGTRFIISDDANYIKDQIKSRFNEKNCPEFLVTGYVTGCETLFDRIFQIQAGEYLSYSKNDNHITPLFYYKFWHENFFSASEEVLLKRLDEVFVHVFQRLITSTKGKGLQIVVPLSGGLDSRIIVAMLKRLGVDDVICYSYGQEGNLESEISKKVAEALGYQWYFIEYTHDKWYQCYHSDEASAFERYAGNLSTLPHFQDFLAVQELHKEGRIPEKSIFIPGHSGDFLAGTYIPLDYDKLQNYSFENYLHEILKLHYSLWELRDKKNLYSYFNKKIFDTTNNIKIIDRESYVNQVLCFVFTERVAKFIVNSVRIYEFFGYSWRMPLWDNELIDFFSKVPLKFRIDENLYIRYAKDILFINNLKQLNEIECTTELNKNLKKSIKKRGENIISNNKILNKIWLKIYYFKKRLFAYDSDPNYGMIQKEKFLKLYSGEQNINSFLALDYLGKFIPTSLDLIKFR